MIHKSLIFLVGLSVTGIAAFAAVKYRPDIAMKVMPKAAVQTTTSPVASKPAKPSMPVAKKPETAKQPETAKKPETKVASLPTASKQAMATKAETAPNKPVASAPAAPKPAASSAPATPEKPTAKKATSGAPKFDIVEVEKDGTSLIAGKAAPNASIELKLDGKVVGKSTANAQGDWLFVPGKSIPAGSHEIIIEAKSGNGPAVRSDQSVIISMPEKSGGTPLIVIASADAPTKVLQKPKPVAKTEIVKTARVETKAPVKTEVAATQPVTASPAKTPASTEPVKVATSQPSAGKKQKLQFGTVDYNDSGDIVFSGKSDPQKNVRLYVDNKHLGDTVANTTGVWMFRDKKNIKSGQHQLRADTISPSGKVTERASVPFFRADKKKVSKLLASRQADTNVEPATSEDTDKMVSNVVIQPGNNLWNIARVIYGKGVAYTTIYEANKQQIRNPDLIFPGQILNTPGVKTTGKIDPSQTEPIEKTAAEQ